jgi:hypothetical protein
VDPVPDEPGGPSINRSEDADVPASSLQRLQLQDDGDSSSDAVVETPSTDSSDAESSLDIETHEIGGDFITLEMVDEPSNTSRDILDWLFSRFYLWREAGAGSRNSRAESHRPASRTSEQRSAITSTRKRSRAALDEESNEDESPGSIEPDARDVETETILFACPFWKMDSRRSKECIKYQLSTVGRVKQHLTRRHSLHRYCTRCGRYFSKADERDSHLVSSGCEARRVWKKWLSEPEMNILSRRSNSRLDPEQQWYAIWDLIFPGALRPSSPYLDNVLYEGLHSFYTFLTEQGPQIIQEMGESEGLYITLQDLRPLLHRGFSRIVEDWVSRQSQGPPQATGFTGNSLLTSDFVIPPLLELDNSYVNVTSGDVEGHQSYAEHIHGAATATGTGNIDFSDDAMFESYLFDIDPTVVSPSDLILHNRPSSRSGPSNTHSP